MIAETAGDCPECGACLDVSPCSCGAPECDKCGETMPEQTETGNCARCDSEKLSEPIGVTATLERLGAP